MTLTVEDGSVVAGADSYISLVDARTLATNYGYALPVDDTEANVALRKGAWYVDGFEDSYTGTRTDEAQSLAWPRTDATYRYGADIESDAIPSQLQLSQVIAAATYGAGTNVRPNDNGQNVASHSVDGAVSQSFFNNGSTSKQITITEANDALKVLFSSSSSNKFSFNVNRG